MDSKQEIKEKEYWHNRCIAAEKFIEESPCDPDITVSQQEAYQQWNRAKDFGTLHPEFQLQQKHIASPALQVCPKCYETLEYFQDTLKCGNCGAIYDIPEKPLQQKQVPEDFEKITGHKTQEEMAAYEKGRDHEQNVILNFVKEWDGSTNSHFGQALHDTFKRLQQKQVLSDEDIEKMAEEEYPINIIEVDLPNILHDDFDTNSSERSAFIKGFKSALRTYSVDGWISVKKELPPRQSDKHSYSDRVEVVLDNGDMQWVDIDRYDHTGKYWDEFHFTVPRVTCWRKLPKPPIKTI